ncbi:MAG: hypothetical protein L0H03_19015 [Rhodococcus sp. (in: high G+C Gram-positive bacteria)]|nr:hypothetical protein [Rhodococcus sp. (in: high G+C Gram-positive bacteria)]
MDERLENTGTIMTVQHCQRRPRIRQVLLREIVVRMGAVIGVVSNYSDPIATPWSPTDAHRCTRDLNTTLRLFTKRDRVRAQLRCLRIVVFTPQARRRPQLTNTDLRQQIRKTQAMVLIGMRQHEGGKIRLPINDREGINEAINNRDFWVLIAVRLRKVMKIDLHHHAIINDDCRTISGANRPEHRASRGKPL